MKRVLGQNKSVEAIFDASLYLLEFLKDNSKTMDLFFSYLENKKFDINDSIKMISDIVSSFVGLLKTRSFVQIEELSKEKYELADDIDEAITRLKSYLIDKRN